MEQTEDEQSMNQDSVVSSMMLTQKKDKTCLVCGDKALGYNFNAVSCESCKAFFRRNAHKTIRGRCEGKCDVNVESRSFCKRCRLAKCFTVGMRKDMILDDEQKLMRKQKILINKLKRHGTLPPEDTYAVSETDISQTFSAKFTSQSVESLRKEYPNLTDNDIQVLRNIKKEQDSERLCDIKAKIQKFKPWTDTSESLDDLVRGISETDRTVILEMNKAHDASCFLSTTITQLKNLPTTPTEMFNVADGFVRRIIKVAKQLSFFRASNKDDQIAMLKGSVVEIMMLRSAVNYDVKTETWNLSTLSCIQPGSTDAGSSSSTGAPGISTGGLDIAALRKAAMAGADLSTLRSMAMGTMKGGGTGGGGMERPPDMGNRFGSGQMPPVGDINHLRNLAKQSGMNVDALRKAAMSGASINDLSQMARGQIGGNMNTPVNLTGDVCMNSQDQVPMSTINDNEQTPTQRTSISAEILKTGNTETKTMFLTYSKFIRSLMTIIMGDLIILKLLVMLSLFSPDRQGIENREQIDSYQESYALALQAYISVKFPEEKNMFARCIMKLTDLRNVNEIHTKMLLSMKVEDIEPLLAEIFDLPS